MSAAYPVPQRLRHQDVANPMEFVHIDPPPPDSRNQQQEQLPVNSIANSSLFHHPRVLSTAHPSGPIIRDPAISQHADNYVCVLPLHAFPLFPPLDSCLSLFFFALHRFSPSDLVPPLSLLRTAVLDGVPDLAIK